MGEGVDDVAVDERLELELVVEGMCWFKVKGGVGIGRAVSNASLSFPLKLFFFNFFPPIHLPFFPRAPSTSAIVPVLISECPLELKSTTLSSNSNAATLRFKGGFEAKFEVTALL